MRDRRFRVKRRRVSAIALLACAASPHAFPQKNVDWPAYNGGVNGDHYSGLKQINRGNVQRLKIAWSFDTGEKGQIQTHAVQQAPLEV